jgi:hypothetical protein
MEDIFHGRDETGRLRAVLTGEIGKRISDKEANGMRFLGTAKGPLNASGRFP